MTFVKNERVSVLYDASSGSVTNCTVDRKDPKLDDGILSQNKSTLVANGNKEANGASLPAAVSTTQKVGLDDDDIPIPPTGSPLKL